MVEKRINFTMVLMSLVGGALGFIIGEFVLGFYKDELSSTVLMGLYFGILAFCIGIMCVIAEVVNPRLNGYGWKNNYLKTSFKFLIPCTLIALFIFGMMFQFIYESSLGKSKKINDVVMLIDTSGSMKQTDPKNERFKAVLNLLDNMNKDNRSAIYKFDDKVEEILPMSEVTGNTKENVELKLKKYEKPDGNTNMKEALKNGYEEIKSNSKKDRNAMIILLSDGGDNYNLSSEFKDIMDPIKKAEIPVYTIGMSKKSDFAMLKRISRESGGNYYSVKDVKDLKGVFNKIYSERQQRLLVDKRNGIFETQTLYMILRMLLIAILGCLIPVGVSFVFDNKNLLKGFIIGGIISGIIAGLILEYGFLHFPWAGGIYRFLSDMVIALIFTIIPVKVDVKDYNNSSYSSGKKREYIKSNNSPKDSF